jgi:nucleoside-triphosphatase THEP1
MIFLLSGPVHSGKTTLLKKAAREFRNKGIRVDGFLSEAVFKGKHRTGYDLLDLREERSIPLLRITGEEAWQKIGPYFFVPSGLEKAEKIILRSGGVDICIVDEVGPLELEGRGFWLPLERVLLPASTSFLISVRRSILEDFMEILGKTDVMVFGMKDKDLYPRLIQEVIKAV